MESTLDFMIASAERFDSIRVSIKKSYYNGVSRNFYLRDNTAHTLENCKILYQQYDNIKDIQRYQLEVPPLNLAHSYEIENAYGLTCPIKIKGIVNDPDFDKYYTYDGDDLGPTYTKKYTSFKVWAPTSSKVMLEYILNGETNVIVMKRQEKGVYYCKVMGDLDGASYIYLVKNDGLIYEATDPYSYSGSINSQRSFVIDLNKIKHNDVKLPLLKQKTDAIIYEISVRDFTSSVYSGVRNRGLFVGLTETGTTTHIGLSTGIDYISQLGVTHVQVMPIYDFGSVDEIKPTLLYNWGYDPNQYNIPEGSYSTDPDDPYARVQECVQMVEAFHKKGIRVNMDVVFNHLYSVNNSAFEKLCPHYYFRNDDFGTFSNGSFCSNDLNTCSFMVRKYIIDMCIRWMKLYHMDGYRFDLMGVIDIFTMNKIQEECYKIDPSVMIYGEGWNLPTMLADYDKAMKDNHAQMPHIGFFNDLFRNCMRGANFNNSNVESGYFTGNMNRVWDAAKYIRNYDVFTTPDQSINYVECHDNETTADKLVYTSVDSREIRMRRLSMMLGAVIFAEGIPFIHSGQEFYRTKHGMSNTYNSPDDINQIKWQTRDKYEPQIQIVRDFIQLRKNNPGFRYATKYKIEQNVNVRVEDESVVIETVRQPDNINEEIIIIYNPNPNAFDMCLEGYEVLYNFKDPENSYDGYNVHVNQVSMIILVKKLKK